MCITALSVRCCLLYVSSAIHKKISREFTPPFTKISAEISQLCVHPPLIVMCVTALSVRCCLLYVSIAVHKKISREFTPPFKKNSAKISQLCVHRPLIMCTPAFNSDVCHLLKCPLLFALRFNCNPQKKFPIIFRKKLLTLLLLLLFCYRLLIKL